ncbi:mechanosensitive ion channel family protein [Marinihelvus fidelis]|uniref:Small-conductance mechanosensitive channel n=2 Tax=Marinihelvus fidelis TaxID=2613842 RepID=A0A5N0T8G6_9GAMM|nr:mechanosensitive ion channel family protein [Marinihelvus fidelis]
METLAAYPLLMAFLVITAGYVLGKILQFLLRVIGQRLTSRTRTDLDDRLLQAARRPALTIPVILSLLVVTALAPLPGLLHRFTVGVLATVLLFSLLRASLAAAHAVLEVLARNQDRAGIIQPRTIPLFEISAKVLLVAIAGYAFLLIWGIDPTAWLASAGVIGIAVGFAARDSLANLFSGIFIVADAPYKIGDYIVLDTGERGEVTHLGLRSTRLLTRDDIEVTIPNAIIANAKIINESGGPWEKHRIRLPVGVAYGSDLDQVVGILEGVAAEHPEVLDDPAPRVRMRAFGPSSLDFELLGWVERPVQRGKVLHELFMAVYRRFNDEGVKIPFPQRDIHIRRDLPDIVDDGGNAPEPDNGRDD